MSVVSDFSLGFSVVFKAIKTVRGDSKLFKLSLVPWFIFMVLFIFSMSSSWSYFISLHSWMITSMEFLGALGSVLSGIAVALAWLIFVVTLSYLIYSVGAVLASPIHSLMAERVLKQLGYTDGPAGIKARMGLIVRMFWVSLLKSVLLLIIGLVLFGFSFFPLFAPICSFIACLIIAMDCSDFAFEVLQMNLRQRFTFFMANLVSYSGLATAVAVTIVIPGLFFLLLPVFVVAATELTYELRLRR